MRVKLENIETIAQRMKRAVGLQFFLVVVLLFVSTMPLASAKKCETEEDVDHVECTMEQLTDEALSAICERMNISLQDEIFPYILQDLNEADPNEYDDGELEAEIASIKKQDHAAYVAAAYECLMIEEHLDSLEQAPDGEHDPFVLANIVKDIIEREPGVVRELEAEIKKENPEMWNEIKSELKAGETLLDRPDLLGELVKGMLEDEPDLLYELDEELNGEDDDDYEEEL
eukprot:CAMPEP_0194049362 /NCGR_PEP_ID=MMETSP0009_2-20130614/30508_1 /TAXON_ID=210454 /ORGANISM="Grammatophora oceanica, Strain CCMP 410" /LENGTH=229 /DNA_ID=CAMNT_0038695501 /DNA_START=136 /DNA_END=825 /DNA_ORIENTATION=-